MNRSEKKLISTTLIAILFSASGYGQTAACGTDRMHAFLAARDSQYAGDFKKQGERWQQRLLSQERIISDSNRTVYEIPVVVHVIHTGGAIGTTYNPSTQQIQNFISYCNQCFAAQFPSFADTLHGGVVVPLRLVLAARDPSCGATNGIVRIDASGIPDYVASGVRDYGGQGNGISDTALKALSRWPNDSYLNIWLVTTIDAGNVSGFATFPQTPPFLDGVVLNVGLSQPSQYGYGVFPHEMGHAFSLLHTFWGDNNGSSCPPNSNCSSDGDGICDTEPHIESFGCPSGVNACTGLNYNNVQFNFMNYTSCTNRFTAGQRDRMLFSLFNYRYTLLTSLGTTPPGIDSVLTLPAASCGPTGILNANNNYDEGLRNVSLADMIVTTKGYTYDGFQYYIDHTQPNCLQSQAVAHLDRDSAYTLVVTSGANPENVRGWIDFDNDGLFSSPELIISSNGTTSFESHTATFTVPATALYCTPLRMRIASDAFISPAPQPCSNPEYGQTEDFIVIIGPLPLSVSITASPGTTVTAGSVVVFTATGATASLNPQYTWRRNGQPVPNVTTATWSATAGISFLSGDVISARVTTTAQCVQPNPALSNSLSLHVTTPTGIQTATGSGVNLKLYPNPNNGSFAIDGTVDPGSDYQLIITNVMGQKIYEQALIVSSEKQHLEICLKDAPPGAYAVTLRNGNGFLKTLPFIKIR